MKPGVKYFAGLCGSEFKFKLRLVDYEFVIISENSDQIFRG